MSNPYEAPKAPLGDTLRNDPGIEQVASGQKLVIYAILVYLAMVSPAPACWPSLRWCCR